MTTTISGSNGIVFPDATSMQTGQQAVKAWVNFDGTGTVSIRAGYNVSSITDNGTGDHTVNFTTAMTDANYSIAGCAKLDNVGAVGNAGSSVISISRNASAVVAGSCRILTQGIDAAQRDNLINTISIFR